MRSEIASSSEIPSSIDVKARTATGGGQKVENGVIESSQVVRVDCSKGATCEVWCIALTFFEHELDERKMIERAPRPDERVATSHAHIPARRAIDQRIGRAAAEAYR